jgi:nitroimidazol reductase NimA-like FMN-containing flavoprotein (pyridoxamine 5'-phosphate oxidase superfamily)
MKATAPSDRTTLRRRPGRGVYDPAVIDAILDEAFVCHVGIAIDGQPYVIPTGYGRSGRMLYVHGSPANRLFGALADGVPACVTVTLVDGYVLARSAFHHSVNYRSVVILGAGRRITDRQEKLDALQCVTNHIMPGRWEETRPPTDRELDGTQVIAIPVDEASAKIRTGPPIDDEQDYVLPVWAGVVPIVAGVGAPQPDARVLPGVGTVDPQRFVRSLYNEEQ